MGKESEKDRRQMVFEIKRDKDRDRCLRGSKKGKKG